MSASVIAFGAISALGRGTAATGVGEVGEPAKVGIKHDALLAAAGFQRPFAARAPVEHHAGAPYCDHAAALLFVALADCAVALDATLPRWRERRVGLALGTSSGGMLSAETWFANIASGANDDAALAREVTYFGALQPGLDVLGLSAVAPATLVLTACAASTVAIGAGMRWLEDDQCDLVIAGGFDALSHFVASGFEVLRATSASVPPRPFAKSRDGMSLGEGAAAIALVSPRLAAEAQLEVLANVVGFGMSADAVHLTAPDRTGAGLARAARAALRDAGLSGEPVELVSGHLTATAFNDSAESEALRASLTASSTPPVIHAFKAQIGHTLGAAGVLESLACMAAMARGILPATPVADEADLETDIPGRLLARAEAGTIRHALKLSAAFGGANAALVLANPSTERPPRAPRTPRQVFVSRASYVREAPSSGEIAERLGVPAEKLARTDGLVRLALAACAELTAREGRLEGAGIVVGHALATLETNASYAARLRERGVRAVEPRKFPYTSPNAVAGECGAAFGWTGPGLAVGAGLHGALDALKLAIDLVRAGDADDLIVLGIDEVGPTSRAWLQVSLGSESGLTSGAAAIRVSSRPSFARVVSARSGIRARVVGEPSAPGARGLPGAWGHRALLPLAISTSGDDGEALGAVTLASACPWGGYAEIHLVKAKS